MKAIKVFFGNLIVFIFLVTIAESIFGYWFFGPDLGFLNVKINQTRIDSNSPYYPPETKVVYRRDQYGLRGNYGSPENITILAVGGSTTNERVVNEGDTWADILQQNLQTFGKNEIVANAGIDGHSTVGHIRSFELWFNKIPGLSPRYIVYYIGVNDRGVAADNIPQPDSLTSPSLVRRISHYIKNHSFFMRGFGNLKGFLAARYIGVAYEYWNFREFEPELVFATQTFEPDRHFLASLDAYRERLKILYKLVSDFGAKTIYVTEPVGLVKKKGGDLYVVKGSNADLIYLQMIEYNRVLMESCASVEAICIDLASELKFGLEDFYDSIHTTPSGSRKIGKFLANKLRQVIP